MIDAVDLVRTEHYIQPYRSKVFYKKLKARTIAVASKRTEKEGCSVEKASWMLWKRGTVAPSYKNGTTGLIGMAHRSLRDRTAIPEGSMCLSYRNDGAMSRIRMPAKCEKHITRSLITIYELASPLRRFRTTTASFEKNWFSAGVAKKISWRFSLISTLQVFHAGKQPCEWEEVAIVCSLYLNKKVTK